MRKVMIILLALVLALPLAARGEGADVLVESFIQRTGVRADAAMREKIGAFLREKSISAQVLDMIDDALLQSYARHLSEDIPIDYAALLDAPSLPMPEGAKVLRLAVLQPEGAAMESLLADFERGLVYYDENWPVPEDVCRAQYAGTLSDAAGAALLERLDGMTLEDQCGDIAGMEFGAIRVAVAWEGGVTRCTAAGEGVSEAFLDGVCALLETGRAAAQGEL
ncbi:MAG: hypothetical protein IJH86_10870 [Clostridia bacterium]|nr:hypothetical protein [Clostridia bacterium]